MLRSENLLNKPSFSRLKNGCSEGRISKKQYTRKKEFLKTVNTQEYNSYVSVSLAEKLIREINETGSYNEQTAEFVEELRKKLFLLHDYNTHVAKVAYTYPTSKEIYELLGKYVALESEVLYKNEYTFKYEKEVESRVFSTIVSFLKESFSTEYDYLNDERKHVFNEALKIFVSYVDVKYTHDEDKFPARIVKNILDNLGLIKKSTANPSGHLDLNNPSLIRLKESLRDSDYGSDDDGQETASVSSESSFRAMVSRRTNEKELKKDVSNFNVDISNARSTDALKETSNSIVSIQGSNDSIRDILVNATNESSQSSSTDSQNPKKNNSDLKPLCNSSGSQSLPNFPTSNEVFSSISNNDRNFFFDFNVDDDIESIIWTESKPQLRQNSTSSNKINHKSKTGRNGAGDKRNIEYRIYDTIAIVSTDDEEDDFEDNLTDFDALELRLEEQKKKQSLLNNLKNKSFEELAQDMNKTKQLEGKKENLASASYGGLPLTYTVGAIPFKEESSDEYNEQNITRNINNIELSCKTMMPEKTENHSEKCIAIGTINAELVIDISSSDEEEHTHMELKEKTITNDIDVNEVIDENNSIYNTQTQMATSVVTNTFTTLESLPLIHSKDSRIIDNNIDIGVAKNRSLLTKGKIFCKSLDELTTVENRTESYKDCHFLRTPEKSGKNCKDAGDTVHRSTSVSQSLFIDLCSPEKYVEKNFHSLTHLGLGSSDILKDTKKGPTEMDVNTQMILNKNDTKKNPQNENLKTFNVRSEVLISNPEAPPEKRMTDSNLDHLTSSKLFSYAKQCIPLQNNQLYVTIEENESSKNTSKNLALDENNIIGSGAFHEDNSTEEISQVETSSALINDGKNSMEDDIVEITIDSDEYDDSNNEALPSSLESLLIKSELSEEDNNPLEAGSLSTYEGVSDSSRPVNKIIECQVKNSLSSFINDTEGKNSDKETNISRNLLEIRKPAHENSNIYISRTEMINAISAHSSFNDERQNNDDINSLSAVPENENEIIVLKKQDGFDNISQYGSSSFFVQNADISSNHQKIISTIVSPELKNSDNADEIFETNIFRSDSTSTINLQDDIIGNLLIDENPHITSSENEANSENNVEIVENNKGTNFVEAEFQASSELLLIENYSGNTDDKKLNKKDNDSSPSKNEEEIIGIVMDSTRMKVIEDKDSVVDVLQYTDVELALPDSPYSGNFNEMSCSVDSKHHANEKLVIEIEKLPITPADENRENETSFSNITEKSVSITESHEVTNKSEVREQSGKFDGTWLTDEGNEHPETHISSTNCLTEEKHPNFVEDNRPQETILYDHECTSYIIEKNEIQETSEEKFVISRESEGLNESKKYSSEIKVLENVVVAVETPILNKSDEYEIIPLNNEMKVHVSIHPDTQHILNSPVQDDGKKSHVQNLPLPAMSKSRSSDSHNVVGNLGKVMLLMTQTEPRRLKRNISFTSPIKMNDPSTTFDNVPNNSSVECDTQKQQFNIDILASVASKQKPLRVDIKQDDENSAIISSDNPKNKQSPLSISKEERNSPHDKIKHSPCASQLINMESDTSFHTNDAQSNSLSLKNKCKNKSISKSHKSGRKKNSYAITSTVSNKATDVNNKNVKQKRHENSQKEELKLNKKSVRRNSSISKDKKIKVIKSKEKSSRIKHGASKKLILENFDSDDSLPLNIRMKKIESSPGECTIMKSSKKDPPSRNSSRNRISKDKGYSKNKLANLQKENEEKQRNVGCKNEIGTKTSIILDKTDKNITISPVKEDRSRRIVHFKKAMLELISQDLEESVSNNSNTIVPEKNLNPLIFNDNQRDTNSSSTISHCEEIVNNKFSSASSALNNIEPDLWNTASETIVEYKVISSNQDNLSDNLNCYTKNPPNSSLIVETHLNSGNISHNLEENVMNTYKTSFSINVNERKQKTDEAVDISSTHSGENIQYIAETADSISNFIPSAVTSEIIKTKIITNENINEKGCLKSNIGMVDSSFLPKYSDKESTELDDNIEFDNPDNIKAIEPENRLDDKIQLVSPNTENDLMKSPSTKSQEKTKSKTKLKNKRKNVGSDEPLIVETEQSCQEKVNKFKENVEQATDSYKSCDLKISLILPINPLLTNKNSELVVKEDKLHRSLNSELNTKETSSLYKNRRKTINKSTSQENSKKAGYTKSIIDNVEGKSLKYTSSSPLKENAQDKILEPPQYIEEKQSAKQKRIPKEDESVTSSPNTIVKKNHKTLKKQTRTLYDTKQELSSENGSRKIKKISVNEKGKSDKKLLINKKNVNDSDEVLGSGINIIKCQEADSQKVKDENTSKSCILLDEITTSAQKYDAKRVEKSGRSKRKRSESETSKKIINQTKKKNYLSPEDTDGAITNRKKSMSNKTILSGEKYSQNRKSCSKMLKEKLNIGTELVKQEIDESIILKTVTKKILPNSPGTRKNNDPSLELENISILSEKIPFVKDVTSLKQKTYKKLFKENICKDNLARGTDIISSETNLDNSDQNEGNNLFKRVEPYSQLDEDCNVGQESVVKSSEMKITEGNGFLGNKCEEVNRESENELKYLSCVGNTKIFNLVEDSSEYSVQINVDCKSTADDIETSKIINNLCEKLEDVTIELSKSDESVEKNRMNEVKNQSQGSGSGKNPHSKIFKTEKNYPSTTKSQQETITEDLSINIEIELEEPKVASPSNRKDELISNYESALKVVDYEDLAVESIIETEMELSEPVFSGEKNIIPHNVQLSLIADDHLEHVTSEFVNTNYKKDGSIDPEIQIKTDNDLEKVNQNSSANNILETQIQVTEQVGLSDINVKLTKISDIPVPEVAFPSDNRDESTGFSEILLADDPLEGAIIEDFIVKPTGDLDVLSNSDEKLKDVINENSDVNIIKTTIQESKVVSRSEGYAELGDSEPLVKADIQLVNNSKDDLTLEGKIETQIHVSGLAQSSDEKDKSTGDYEVQLKSNVHLESVNLEDLSVVNNVKTEIQVSEAVSLCDKKNKITKYTKILTPVDRLEGVMNEDFTVNNINENENQSEDVSSWDEKDESRSDSEMLQKSDDGVEDFSIGNNIEDEIQVTEAVSPCDKKDKSIKDIEILPKSDDLLECVITEDFPAGNINKNEVVSLSDKKDESSSYSEIIQKPEDHLEDVIIEDFSVGINIAAEIQVCESVSLCEEKDRSTKDTEILPKSDNHLKDVIIEDFGVDIIHEREIQSEAVTSSEEKDESTNDSDMLKNSDYSSEDVIVEDFPFSNKIEAKMAVSAAVTISDEKEKSTSDSEVLQNSDDHSKDVIEDFPVSNNIEAKIQVPEAVSLCDEKDKSTSGSEVLQNSDYSKDVILENFQVSSNIQAKIQVSEAGSLCDQKDKSTTDSEVLQDSEDYSKDVIIDDFPVANNIEAKIQVSDAVSLCDKKDKSTKAIEILPKLDDHLEGVIIEDFPVDNINENESQSEAVSPSDEKVESKIDSEVLQKSDENVKDVITEDFSVGNNIETKIQISGAVSLCDKKDTRTKDTETLSKSDDCLESAIIEDFPVDNNNENKIASEAASSSYKKDNSTSDYEVLQESDNQLGVEDVNIGDFSVINITETEIQVTDAVPSSEKDKASASEFLPKPDGNAEDIIHENVGISRTIETIQISEAIFLKNEKDKLASDSEVLQKPVDNSEDIIRQNLDVGNIIQNVQISESDLKDILISDSEKLPKLDNHLKNVINENFAVGNIIETDIQLSEAVYASNENDQLPSDTELTSTPDVCSDISKSTHLKELAVQNIAGIEDGANEKYYSNAKEDMLEDTKLFTGSLVDESKNLPLKGLTVDTSSEQRHGILQISIPKKSQLVDETSEIIKLPNNKRKYFEGQEETDTFILSKKCNTQMIINKKEKLSESETSLKIFCQSGQKFSNESEPEGNDPNVLQVSPNILQETVENLKYDTSNPIKYQEIIQVTECPPPSDTVNLRTPRMIVLNEGRLISSENISKLSTSKNLNISIDSEAKNNMQPSEIDIPEIQSSETESSCHLTEKININIDHFQENHTSSEITKECLEYVEVTKEPEQALNLSFHKSEISSTEGKISVEEQSIQPIFSSICQETPEIQSLNPSKNELSFSIERMLQPCFKNQQKKNGDNLQNMTEIETSRQLDSNIATEDQANKTTVCTNVISDTFKHPSLLNYDNLVIKKNKNTSQGEIEEMKQINKEEKPNSIFKVEENRKVIVERVYSMDELAVGTPISPCLNICSAPILPISTEFIPYRYGIYNTVIPTSERTIVNDSCVHSKNEGTSNKNTFNLDARIETKTVYEEKDTKKETSILEKEIKSTVDTKKIADTKILKSEYNTLVETTVPSKSENDIEIVQVEGQNDTTFEIQKFGHSVNIQKSENKFENLDQLALNMDKCISPNQNNRNSLAGDVQHTQNSSLPFISTENKPDQVKQFDTFIKKTDDKKKLSLFETIDNANISDHCSDVFKSEINQKTKKFRKCSESILSCSKSNEQVGKPKHHSNDQNLHLDEFNGLNTDMKKSTNILNESLSLKPLNEMKPISQSVKLNEDSGNEIFIENINKQQNISSSISSTFNMGQVGADSKTVAPSKYPNDSSLESHKIETRANIPPTEVSSLLNTNMEQSELSDSFVNKVVVQSSGSEGMESFLSNFQSAITIAQNISSLQGSFSLFSDNSDDIQFAQQNQVQNEEILHVDFQEKAVLPINQPEAFINNRLNLPQSTPIRSQGTSQADESIFNMSDDIFDFDFNNVNQTASGSTYSNSFVNATMSSENLQMIFDNPEFLHLLYNLNDVGCEVTVDNTNVEDMAAKPAEYIAAELIQEQLEIPPFIAEEEFDSNAPTDPMVGGQKELVPDPKQDSTLDEVPFPESALSFDEEMMHRYALFLHCDVNSTGQSSAADKLNQTKNLEGPAENSVVQSGSKQNPEYALIDQKTSNYMDKITPVEEKSLANSSKNDIENSHSATPQIQETANIGPNTQETTRSLLNSSLKTLSPNSSSECNKSSNKTIGKTSVKVQKIPASKYAPPKKQRNHDAHQTKKPQEKVESKLSKTSSNEGKNLTLDLEFNNSLDMPELFSPNETSYKSKSLPSIPSNKSKTDSKTRKLEGQSIKKSEKPPEDDSSQQMQYNMYDRTKAMKRNAAMRENYCEFFDDVSSSSNKNKKRKISIKAEPGNHTNFPNVKEETSEKRNLLNEYESQTKKIKNEDMVKHETCETKNVAAIPQGVQHPHVIRDLNAEFDKLKNSGPYKSSGPKNIKYTRTDRILRSAQEACSSHYQASTSSQHNYADRGKREDRVKRENTECYRKSEDLRRKPRASERSRSPHSRSSAYTSTSSDYRRENFRRSKPLETKRNDGWYGREPYIPSDERRRTFEGHHSRDLHRKVDRSYKPSSSRTSLSQSQQKSDSKNGEEWFKKLDELWPLERNVYQSTGH